MLSNNGKRALLYMSQLATIVTVLIAAFTLFPILEDVKSSKEALNALKNIVDTNNEQLNAVNRAVTQISHQTIMQAYLNGTPFSVSIENCNYDEANKKINYRIVILDNKKNLTPLKFMIDRYFNYYTIPDENEIPEPRKVGNFPQINEELLEPGQQRVFELSLSEMFNETKDLKNSQLYVRSEYYIAPYSDAINHIITDYVYDEKGHLMIAFEKNPNTDEWQILTSNKNSVCK